MTLSELFGNQDLTDEERKFLEQVARLWADKQKMVIRETVKTTKDKK